MSMSYTPSPLYPSASQPTRRDRMASALRTLMTNDNLDPEILRAGTQWMTALEEFTQTFTPQATFQPASAQTNLPLDINTTPIDLALCTGSSFPLESGPSSTNPVQSWLGDIFSRPSLSNNLPAHLMGCDFTLDFARISDEGDVILNSAEIDHSSSTSTSTSICNSSVGTSSLADFIAQTPQTSPAPLLSLNETSTRPPLQLPFATDRRSQERSRPRPSKHQRAHYIVEKRYRAGLHERFEALRECVENWKHQHQQKESQQEQQSSSPLSPGTTTDGTNEGANRGATRLNKSEVLCEAVAYINLLQEENEVVIEHMKLLIRRFRATKQALQQG
ncbi:hypothetical protein POX_f08117 [Penicillium oxalicum]|uniref:BHLH domain-containing protein n=1 Tax=Penicillium oxalicum (strain 114-2 / CGMCC 5302) TaxID=933388 RepID=S7ZEH5_PENO1|nr:hypothetical protein POX_f08117 [Penicillium oxalicum]EPS29065.1 hypothetical protein PDE_04012 [Penicillium oxalicum 114-2]KAI2787740.1 hypothetical protein POX_f08117 [Penicillium oxalicum]